MTTNTNRIYDVAVIGAGVIGTSTAYHLVKAGLKVALIEKSDVARGTSSHCDAAALIVDKLPGADAALGYASIKRFLELQTELSYDFELHQRGSMYVCESEQEMEIATQYAKSMVEDGYKIDSLDPKQLKEMEPFIADDLYGGIFSPVCCGLNPFKLCFAFVDQVNGHGLDLYSHTQVQGIKLGDKNEIQGVETDKGFIACSKVVNACGVWSPEIGRMVGVEIPVEPRKGVILISAPGFPICHQKIQEFGYMVSKFDDINCERDPDVEKYNVAFTIEPSEGNNVLIGSSRNFAGFDISTEIEIVHTIAKRACRFFPILKEVNCIRSYAGVRPFIPEHLPLITEVERVPGFYIAAGHEGDGISMAPMTGRLMAELITGQKPHMDLTPFSYKRYDK